MISVNAVLSAPIASINHVSVNTAAFIPAQNAAILLWASNYNGDNVIFSGTNSTPTLLLDWLDTESDSYGIAGALNVNAVSQSFGATGTPAATDLIMHWVQLLGVQAFGTTTANNNQAPGSGAGAIKGISTFVAANNALVAWVSAEDALETMNVAGSGTQLVFAPDNLNLLDLCVGIWPGNGANIIPTFTAANGANNYTVIQQLLIGNTTISTMCSNGHIQCNEFVETGVGSTFASRMFANGVINIGLMNESTNLIKLFSNGAFQANSFDELATVSG